MNSSQHYFGPYQLQQRLGGNGTREVWQVLDERRQDIVVVSILHVSDQEASELLPRFLYETKNLQSLRHPNIASILDVQVATRPATDVQSAGNDAYIVTRWVDGPSLANYMATTSHIGTFPTIANLHQMLAPIASALDYAHQNGIIHGYINPTSILFDARSATESSPGEPRIVNFGMHAMRSLLTLPLSDVCYISPEIAQGHTENTRSDLYSLGVILYELCTGTLPFQADSVADMMMQHIHATPMAPVLINPRIVPGLAAIIMHCLAKEPSARFPTVSALVTALDRLMKSPASISLGLSNPGFSTGQQQALGSSRGLSGQQQALSLPPGSSLGLSDPGFGAGQQQALSLPPGSRLDLFSADQQQTLSSTPASGDSPSSNPGSVPSPLAYGSAPVVSQYNQPSSASGPADDSSPTFLTPARNSMHIALTSAQTIISPPSSYAPVENGAPHPPAQPRRRLLPLLLTLIVVFLLIMSGIVALFWYPFNGGLTTNRPVFGHTFFTSSGLINQINTNGIADGVQVELQNLPVPQPGKSYYAWLLADTDTASDAPPIALGELTVHNEQATKTFVDPQNKDLLFKYSRFLVTEEDASTPPANPSLNTANWRYAALFSRVPNPDDLVNHYSVLDHLRHLLAQDPTLKKAGLDGGLDTWLFRNTLKILEWSGSARDAYKTQDTESHSPSVSAYSGLSRWYTVCYNGKHSLRPFSYSG